MKRFAVVMLLLFCQAWAMSQTVITGKLLDEAQQPIANVSVSYKKLGGLALLGFTKTSQDGGFRLALKLLEVDSIQLDFNHLSYARRSVVVLNKSANYAYVLNAEFRQIQEIKVANMPIFQRKDTINYSVGAFMNKDDRVIADIIKKLPGIEMKGNQIFYQGRPIQKFKVNNLDLMEGRYAIINNNLPAEAVKNVQVIENDQPIKILDSLVFSADASINLELKRYTSTGTGKVAFGGPAVLWDVNLTPMTFNKDFQMLNSFQSNNTGNDAAKDLGSFYSGAGYMSVNENLSAGPSYSRLRELSTPNLDEKKWLDNKLFMFSSNLVRKLKSGMELKGNMSYYNDTRKRIGYTTTQYFTAEETIMNNESIDNRYRLHVMDAGLLLEKNQKQVYLRNKFSYHKRWDADRGNLLFNAAEDIVQRRNYTDESLLNSFAMARFFGKQLVNIRSLISYQNTPQQLRVLPGQFEDLLNTGLPYDEMHQDVNYKVFRFDNSLGFMRKIQKWSFAPTANLNYKHSDLDSYISTLQGSNTTVLGSDYRNELRNGQLNLALSLRIGWENQTWKFSLNNPYNLYRYNLKEQGLAVFDKEFRNTYNPSTSLTYLFLRNHQLSTNLSMGRSYADLTDFYRGFMISNYRSIQRYDTRLLRADAQNVNVRYQYKNVLIGSFAQLGYSYGQADRDYMFGTALDTAGRSTIMVLDRNSATQTHTLSADFSHYVRALKTVVKLNSTLGWRSSDYLLNAVLDKQIVFRPTVTLELLNTMSKWASFDYKTDLSYSASKFAAGNKVKVFSNSHFLNMGLFLSDQHRVSFKNALYHNNVSGQKNQYFLDANYRYTLLKWKTDIEFTAQNILNNNQYLTQFVTNYELIQSSFELRPRQFMVSTRFRF